ncbi:hypothetical protein EG68_08289 [Paragonimus skrjabini miyazakii]|uniref:Uncharacterized protein n=1 Tax=Paragonimus skrjabini miyazakii TaxID=59628 RepID=A0A8S9YUW4_9TREM|nr:hypothetical protein EG68_08289 [Paragonimus skrjabini miyazakii]
MNAIRQRNAEACRMWRFAKLPRPQPRKLEYISSETFDRKSAWMFRITELKAIQKEVQRLRKQRSHTGHFIQCPFSTANYTRRQGRLVWNEEKDALYRVPVKVHNKQMCSCTGCCLNSQCCPKKPQGRGIFARRTHAFAGASI